MKQSLSLEPERVYHIYNRANGNERLFLKDEHYFDFLERYGRYVHPAVDTLAYCLLPNHFHFMVRIKSEEELRLWFSLSESLQLSESENLSERIAKQFGNLFSSYTQSFNLKNDRKGSLFTPRFKRKLVEDPHYFTQLVAYIHLNPVKHGYVEDPLDWTYSSYHAYNSNLKSKVRTDIILDFFGGSKEDLRDFHKNYNEKLVEVQGLGLE